jgi:dihydrofolate reductase
MSHFTDQSRRTPSDKMSTRSLRYNVAASLDGFIADRNGAFDWILHDPTVDFAGLSARADTIVVGRRTYEAVQTQGPPPWAPGTRVYVVSRTLAPEAAPGVTVVGDDPVTLAASLRHEPGSGEIWLFGGGQLFATLLAGGQVDSVEVTVVPILLGRGVPLLGSEADPAKLDLVHTKVYPSGMVALHYSVPGAAP